MGKPLTARIREIWRSTPMAIQATTLAAPAVVFAADTAEAGEKELDLSIDTNDQRTRVTYQTKNNGYIYVEAERYQTGNMWVRLYDQIGSKILTLSCQPETDRVLACTLRGVAKGQVYPFQFDADVPMQFYDDVAFALESKPGVDPIRLVSHLDAFTGALGHLGFPGPFQGPNSIQ